MLNSAQSVENSSGTNRNLSLFFVAFLFYIAISIASTTDLMLFMPDSFLELPIIGINLPLKGFYIVAPFLILIFHYYLLVNLEFHCIKLLQLSKETEDEDAITLHPFIINYLIAIKPGTRRKILKFVIRISAFYLPLLILFYILFRFADYQSYLISSMHLICILLDLYLIYSQTSSIMKVFTLKDIPLAKKADFSYKFLLWKLRLLNKLSRKKKFGTRIYAYYKNGIKYQFENLIIFSGTIYYIWFVLTITGCFGKLSGFWSLLEYTFPKISIENEVLVKYPEQKKILQTDWLTLSKEEKLSKYTSVAGIDLTDRNLMYCNLSNCIMINAKLENSNFDYAKLDNIVLTGSRLSNTNFNFASLCFSDFSGSTGEGDFIDADLSVSNFSNTKLQCDFIRAFLGGAIFDTADLNNSRFTHAELSRVKILNSKLFAIHFIGANMDGAEIRNCKIESCEFIGTCLKSSIINNDTINESNFDGADLSSSDLSNTVLNTTTFKGAIFTSNEMSNTVVCDSSFAYSFTGFIFAVRNLFVDSSLYNPKQFADDSMVINPYYQADGANVKLFSDPITHHKINDTILVLPPLFDLTELYGRINSSSKYLPFRIIDSLKKAMGVTDTAILRSHYFIKEKYDSEFLKIRTRIIMNYPNAARSMFGNRIEYVSKDDEKPVLMGLEDTLLFNHIKQLHPRLFRNLLRTIPIKKETSIGKHVSLVKAITSYTFPELFSIEEDFIE